ncbi:hypothetical protein PA7_05100 [Pseudonocardia asaccharolytica DSM 44247 = NBRC 16224]|uniref:Uncharacterized protein n=1 Tax=Pseudonocardia asaccharolytica DSM 44247 = NBRC 16224 TaxID=1123024 RepID=A0A511CWQ1_9PSEU|nr:hypothetical protein PA7_05100 [Pseudonocardia asaccharolytica DSM 44247 = NBRC 16224]
MLVRSDQRRSTVGEGEAEPGRSRIALGVAEPRREIHVGERPQQRALAAGAAEHQTLAVGEPRAIVVAPGAPRDIAICSRPESRARSLILQTSVARLVAFSLLM